MIDQRFKACILASRCGSISAAANSLYISKQAVKKQIDSLENELGVTLFFRSSKGLAVTPAGKIYIKGIERLMDQHSQLVSRCFDSEKTGNGQSLTILQPHHPKLYFKDTLTEYNKLYPNIFLRVIDTRKMFVLYNNIARLRTLIEGNVDIVFAPYEDKYDKAILSYTKLCNLPYYCAIKRGHPLSTREYITREELYEYPVRINTVVDRNVYEHIISQEVPFVPMKIIHSENESFSVPEVISFCLNNGIFITKGDYLDTLDPLIAIPLKPSFCQENGLYFRKDAPEHVKLFIDMVREVPWKYRIDISDSIDNTKAN